MFPPSASFSDCCAGEPSGSPATSPLRSSSAAERSMRIAVVGGTGDFGLALVCGDDGHAKELALEVAAKVVTGRALDAGPLAGARALEGMTAVIVNLNRRYKGHAGVSVTGL